MTRWWLKKPMNESDDKVLPRGCLDSEAVSCYVCSYSSLLSSGSSSGCQEFNFSPSSATTQGSCTSCMVSPHVVIFWWWLPYFYSNISLLLLGNYWLLMYVFIIFGQNCPAIRHNNDTPNHINFWVMQCFNVC